MTLRALHRLRHRPGRRAGRRACCSSLSLPAICPTPANSRAPVLAWRVQSGLSNRLAARSASESQPGEGAQFFFTVPVSASPIWRGQRRDWRRRRNPGDGGAAIGLSVLLYLRRRQRRAHHRPPARAVRQPGDHRSRRGRRGGSCQPEKIRSSGRGRGRSRFAGGNAGCQSTDTGGGAARRSSIRRGGLHVALADQWRCAVSRHRFGVWMIRKRKKTRRVLVEQPASIDAVAFSALEKSVGTKALIEILQCYIVTAEQLTNACRMPVPTINGTRRHAWRKTLSVSPLALACPPSPRRRASSPRKRAKAKMPVRLRNAAPDRAGRAFAVAAGADQPVSRRRLNQFRATVLRGFIP